MKLEKRFRESVRKQFPDKSDQEQIFKALDYAKEKHAGQKRLSGESYIIHPISVANILLEWNMDRDSIIAGLLHDTVEDTDATLGDITRMFGSNVALLVDGVTKVGQARAGMQDIDHYLPQTKDNLTKLLVATGQDVRVIMIKLADRLHNLRTLQYQPRNKQLKIARESLEIFGPLADRLNMGRVRVQIEDLSFKYLAPKRYEKLRHEINSRISRSKQSLEDIKMEVSQKLTDEGIKFRIDGRIKSVYSLHKKLTNKHANIDDIYDLIALRVIVDDITTCYLVLGLIHQMYRPLIGRIKDYISRPKPNGYQSLHTTVETPKGQIVEFQIRTEQMHEYAEHGLAAAFHYNEQKVNDSYKNGTLAPLPADLRWIQELQAAAGKLRQGEKVNLDDLKVNLFSDRIFVNSPNGDIFDLPAGSLPLDFAYQVHSEVAAKAAGFKINGKIARFDQPLKSGDTVEVITRRNVIPRVDWLNKIVTSHARSKLRAQLRKAEAERLEREYGRDYKRAKGERPESHFKQRNK